MNPFISTSLPFFMCAVMRLRLRVNPVLCVQARYQQAPLPISLVVCVPPPCDPHQSVPAYLVLCVHALYDQIFQLADRVGASAMLPAYPLFTCRHDTSRCTATCPSWCACWAPCSTCSTSWSSPTRT
jgi:hypothetical protein